MNKINDFLEKITGVILAALMVATVITVLWQVFSRYILQSPSEGSEEIARFLLIWIGLFGATFCYQKNSHLSLDLLKQKLASKGKIKLTLFGHFVALAFIFSVLIFGGIHLVLITLTPIQLSPVLGMKIAYVYAVVPFTGSIMFLSAFYKIIKLSLELKLLQQAKVL